MTGAPRPGDPLDGNPGAGVPVPATLDGNPGAGAPGPGNPGADDWRRCPRPRCR